MVRLFVASCLGREERFNGLLIKPINIRINDMDSINTERKMEELVINIGKTQCRFESETYWLMH